MAANKAWITGADALVNWFDENVSDNKPYWSLWQAKNMLSSFCEDDKDKARAALYSNIATAEQNGVDDVFWLRLHNTCMKGGYITDKNQYYASVPFRPSPLTQMGALPQYYPMPPQQNNSALDAIMDRIDEMESRINAPVQQEPAIGGLNALLNNPQVIGALTGIGVNLLTNLINKIMPNALPAQQLQQVAAMGDIDIKLTERLKVALITLAQIPGVNLETDIEKMAMVGQTNPQLFNSILNSLRAM